MPLRRKLLIAMVIPGVLLALVGSIGLYSLRHLEQAAGHILSNNYRSIQETRQMDRALRQLEHGGLRQALAGGRGEVAEVAALRGRLITRFDEALARCEGNITERGESELLRRIREQWRGLRELTGKDATSTRTEQRARRETYRLLFAELAELIRINEEAMFSSERETRRVAGGMFAAVAGVSLVAVVALVFFALVSAGRISRPVIQVAERLHQALNPAERAAEPRRGRSQDEILRLREEMDALLERLRRYEDEQARELSNLQQRLALVMNEVLEGLVLLDKGHRVVAMNRVARALLGPGATEGQTLGELQPSASVREVLAPLVSGTFEPERDLGEIRYEVDGAERIYRPRVLTVRPGETEVEGYLVLFWDVTEQRRFEEARRRLISMLSHQLKTPMTSLQMSVNLLREKLGGLDPAQAELLAIATENCGSLASLVSELIEAAREVTPDLVIAARRSNLTRLLRAALRPLQPQAADKGVTLELPPEGPGPVASVDPVKFPWVITNIAGNALRYTGEGGTVRVGIRAMEDSVEVTVADSGAGIATENLARIFQPYVSLDAAPAPGTHGLGLAIAREIVEAHGGHIGAESTLGIGTTFRIRIPAGKEQGT